MQQKNEVSWADVGRKLLGALCSMGFSLALLAVLLAGCVAGSVIPQGQAAGVYTQQFGARGAQLVAALGLDHVFECGWFAAAAALLAVNLTLCSLVRAPRLWRRWRTGFTAAGRIEAGGESFALPLARPVALTELGCRPARVKEYTAADGTVYHYAAQNTVGLWGSWLCHLGMLLIMAGFALGQSLSTEAVVYGIPGSTQPIGETGYQLTIDDFTVSLREDHTVEQYTAALTVTAPDGTAASGEASVNHPLTAFGMSLYQDSTGWANYVDIAKDGEPVGQDLLCAGEYTAPATLPQLVLLFNKFYPDLARSADGSLTSATPLCQNPHSLYSIYYQGQLLTMDLTGMDAPIEVNGYTFTMHDPVQYTLIVIRRDPTAWFVGLAGAVMVLGIILAFYCRPQEIWTDGKTLFARAEKAPGLLRQTLEQKLKQKGL